MLKQVGSSPWWADEDGNLSLFLTAPGGNVAYGQTQFALYNCEGHVDFTQYATYQLIDGRVHSTIHKVPEIKQ